MKEILKQNKLLNNRFVKYFYKSLYTSILKFRARGNITNYLNDNSKPKLHIGCGNNYLDGWLNTDIDIGARIDAYVDITVGCPCPDEVFNFIFSEHVLEHIQLKHGKLVLKECYRLLKSGGSVRISVPSLDFLFRIYSEASEDIQKFIGYYLDRNEEKLNFTVPRKSLVINKYLYGWGHITMYDEQLLSEMLKNVGFVNLTKCMPGQSEYNELRNIDARKEYPGCLQSLIIEAKKN